jgi:hypothetical protein
MRLLLLALLIAVSSATSAQPYASIASGKTNVKLNVGPGLNGDVGPVWLFTGGYKITRYLSAEATYLDTNDISGTQTDSATASQATLTTHSWDAHGIGLFAVGTLPIGKGFDFVGKLGAYRMSTTTRSKTETVRTVAPFGLVSAQDHGTDKHSFWAPGIAAGVQFTPSGQHGPARVGFGAMLELAKGKEIERFRTLSVFLRADF